MKINKNFCTFFYGTGTVLYGMVRYRLYTGTVLNRNPNLYSFSKIYIVLYRKIEKELKINSYFNFP